jgi:hypothetical protein
LIGDIGLNPTAAAHVIHQQLGRKLVEKLKNALDEELQQLDLLYGASQDVDRVGAITQPPPDPK